jgi:hypothetical protein
MAGGIMLGPGNIGDGQSGGVGRNAVMIDSNVGGVLGYDFTARAYPIKQ